MKETLIKVLTKLQNPDLVMATFAGIALLFGALGYLTNPHPVSSVSLLLGFFCIVAVVFAERTATILTKLKNKLSK